MVHGDDYCSVGDRRDIEWFRRQLDCRFSIKTTMVGDQEQEEKEVRVLNRFIRYTEHGWEYEADQRHAEVIIQDLDMKSANPVASAGEDENAYKVEENLVELTSHDSSRYRQLAARANYLAPDRPDIQYAVKELCRKMSCPTRGDWKS